MPTLMPEELRTRDIQDARSAAAIDASHFPVSISGFHSVADATANRNAVALDDEIDPPSVYRMTCNFETLEAPNLPLHGTVYVIDTRGNGDYPGSEPLARIVSTPVPFAPHIGSPSGAVCHGHLVWVPFRTQLAEYLAQLCRLLNYDEPPPSPRSGFSAMNPAALRYWAKLGHRPLHPDLGSPVVVPARARRRTLRRVGGSSGDRVAATVNGRRTLRRAVK